MYAQCGTELQETSPSLADGDRKSDNTSDIPGDVAQGCIREVVKNLPPGAGDAGLIPGSERSPGGGNGNPFRYSCLGNPMDRGAGQSAVHGAAKTQTQPSDSATRTVVS